MKTVTMYGVMSLAAMMFAGSALADQAAGNQNIAKRPLVGQAANQAWEGASLQIDKQPAAHQVAEQKEQFRKQLNLQYASKRPYVKPDSAE
ncbi:hypothetical protein [Methylophilus aquaticus]|uniref:DUF4148 domain-containing protein n=1 Tax=Methylophilus aquaticus TaxID=1971610 RepID=A0ABT9JRN6_9PROT|nr:hypothetical protein [Methylophilus aquaticus]MDP8567228.1 hypothetical protein [Methylophilus aquaticus]